MPAIELSPERPETDAGPSGPVHCYPHGSYVAVCGHRRGPDSVIRWYKWLPGWLHCPVCKDLCPNAEATSMKDAERR